MTQQRGANEAFAFCFVDELSRLGVTDACVSPGSRSGPLALQLARDGRIRVHVHTDERSAAFMALGLARSTRRPAVVLTTSGTAAANLFPAIVEARHDRVALIALTADRPPELRATGANQTIDQVKMFGDVCLWFADAGVPDTGEGAPRYWRSLASRAFAEATGIPAGPVHVNVPLRDPLLPDDATPPYPHRLDGRPDGRPWTRVVRPETASLGDARISEQLLAAERGVVLVGATTADVRPLLEIARTLGWPVLAEPASNARVPGTISTYDGLLRVGSFRDRFAPDLVLRAGKLGLGRPVTAMLRRVPQISCDPDAAWLDEVRGTELLIAGEPSTLARSVAEGGHPRTEGGWLQGWEKADAVARRAIDEVLDGTGSPTEPRTARDVAAALSDGSALFAASSMPVRDLESFMAPRAGLRVYSNRGTNGIDGCVSTAVGVALGSGAPVAALLGDLALLHDSNGLLGAARRDIDLTVVVINNDGGGIFSFLEQAGVDHFEEVFGTPHGLDLANLAALHGLTHVAIERADELVPALQPAGVKLVEVRTDREQNVAFHRRIWDAVEAALASDL